MKHKEKLYLYLKTIAVGLVIFAAVLVIKIAAHDDSYLRKVHDGLFTTAVLMVGYGLLRFAANEGTLDIMGYGFKSVISLFTPFQNRSIGGYYEYKQAQKAKRKPTPVHIIWVGCGFLLSSILIWVIMQYVLK